MENDYEPSDTTFNQLPLELLDVVLENSLLLRILNSSPDQRDEDVIKSLESVDFCWFQRITRPIFKKRFLQLLKGVYGKTKKRSTIIRNNRNYLLENIHPNDELIDSLFSLNCITVEQSHFIQRQRLNRDKNAELLYVVRSFDERKFSNFEKCLRQTNQKTVARIIENGGGVIKIEVQTRAAEYATSMELHQKIEDLRNRTKPRSHQTDKLISQLWEEGIEILNSHLEGQTGVVWIWCHSQAALEYIQRLYESNQLMDILIGLANIQRPISKVISIDRKQFKKTIVVRPISINFTQRIAIRSNQLVNGLTKLRNEIYVLCTQVICVFEDQIPFRLVKKIKVTEINDAREIESNEVENCLYVPDRYCRCVWKITREVGDQQKIIKWLTTDYNLRGLSVTSDGHILMVNDPLSDLNIYGSDAKLIRSIHLSRDVEYPLRVVETSTGNFGILHTWLENDKGESGSKRRMQEIKGGICELVRDKHNMVVRRFIPSNETQQLNDPSHLLLDSDDQVFVADAGNNRVILLNSDFKWNQHLCSIKEETGRPNKMCYDEERKQLIVGGNGVNVYTLSRN